MGHNLVLCFIFDDFGFLQEQYGHSVVFGGFTWCRSFGGYCTSSSSSGVSSDPYSYCGFGVHGEPLVAIFMSRGTKTRSTVTSCPLQHPQVKEKLANMVQFDKATYDKMMKEIPKAKLITPSVVSERLKVNGSVARQAIRHL